MKVLIAELKCVLFSPFSIFFKNSKSSCSTPYAVMSFSSFLMLALVFVGVGLSMYSPESLRNYLAEDGFIEWFQYLMFSFTVFFLIAIRPGILKKNKRNFFSMQNLVFISLITVFAFGALEEVSWFQRVIDFKTTDFFSTHNVQNESNIHNLRINGVKVNKLIFGKILFLLVLLHNVILPFLASRKPKLKKWIQNIGVFLPPAPMVVAYALGAIFVSFINSPRAKELFEIIGSIHYFTSIFVVYILGWKEEGPKLFKSSIAGSLIGRAFIFSLLFLMLSAWILGSISLRVRA